MIMHKLVYILLGCGFSVVILINLFRKFFSKVFRFLSAVLLLTLVCSFIAAMFHWITYREMINLLLVFGIPLKIVNKLIV